MIGNLKRSFSRPANTTAYASGDLVANSATAGSVTATQILGFGRGPGGSAILRRVGIMKSGTSTTNADFRVHFYKTSAITCANGDNGAFSTDNVANYLGYADVTVSTAFTDGSIGYGAPAVGSEFMFTPDAAGRSIYALVEARAAYTPASGETFTIIADMINEVA